jgi:RNA polymerase sigma-70 factor (ECF subfamily)
MPASPDELSREEFAEFYRRSAPGLWSFVRRTCGDPEQADDILQEALLRFLRGRPAGMDDRQKRAYLFKISSRLIMDGWRRASLEKKHLADRLEAGGGGSEDLAPDMERTFALLKPRDRTLLWLAHVEGYSHEEIATIIGLRGESIKVLLFRSRSALAKLLKERGYRGETDHE